jgi:hypothetical protein
MPLAALGLAVLVQSRPTPLPTNNPGCIQYYGAACSEALGQWLPGAAFGGFTPWREGKTAKVAFLDSFVYSGKGHVPAHLRFGTRPEPADGTFFVYGDAGPPKGNVVYDYRRHIAFYFQGCCSWQSTIAANAAPPPKRVANRDLSTLHTQHGIALGDSVENVLRIYGPAQLSGIPGHPALKMLSYVHMVNNMCGQFDNFAFRNNRLISIELLTGC